MFSLSEFLWKYLFYSRVSLQVLILVIFTFWVRAHPKLWSSGSGGGEAWVQLPSLPVNMVEMAKSIGIQKLLLLRYLELQASAWPLGPAIRPCTLLRNRMLIDPDRGRFSYLFSPVLCIDIDDCLSVWFCSCVPWDMSDSYLLSICVVRYLHRFIRGVLVRVRVVCSGYVGRSSY